MLLKGCLMPSWNMWNIDCITDVCVSVSLHQLYFILAGSPIQINCDNVPHLSSLGDDIINPGWINTCIL